MCVCFVSVLCVVVCVTPGLRDQMRRRYFCGHSDDVRCVNTTADGRLAASGQVAGEDELPSWCVWEVATMRQLQRVACT